MTDIPAQRGTAENRTRARNLATYYTDRQPLSTWGAAFGTLLKAVPNYTDEQITVALDRLLDEQRPLTTATLLIGLRDAGGPRVSRRYRALVELRAKYQEAGE